MNDVKIDSITTFVDVDILVGEELLKNTSITIENNKIHSIGQRHGNEISLPGFLILPGMINAHTHSPMNFLKDICHGQKNMIDNIFFKTESQLNDDLTENLSYSYILSGLKSGVTTFSEHYYFMNGIARAFDKVGVRGFIGETLADLGGAFPDRNGLKKFEDNIKNWEHSDRIKPVICPHAADTVSSEYAIEISKFAKDKSLPLHFHLAQRKEEYDILTKQYGKTPVELAHEWGWLGENSLAVHLLHVNDKDIKILKDTKTSAVSCPSSQILYEFLAPIEKFFEAELSISLGTDCAASNDQADILSELKVLALMARDRGVSLENLYKKIYDTVTINPAKVFSARIGEIKPGNLADVVFVRQTLDTLPLRDIWTHILFSYDSQHVEHVMIDGRFVLKNKKLCLADEHELTEKFNKALAKIKL